jgi:hypothetical protein
MHFRHQKPIQETPQHITPQAEITEIFIAPTDKGLIAYHETFMSPKNYCEYKGLKYNEPIEETQHYAIGRWNWGRKLSMYFTQHTTQAKFLDWCHFAANVSYPVNYLHKEGTSDPLELKVKNLDNFENPTDNADIDWSKINYAISQNTTIEGTHADVDALLRGNREINWNPLILLIVVVIAIACCVVGGFYFLGGHHTTTIISNSTLTNSTSIPVIS